MDPSGLGRTGGCADGHSPGRTPVLGTGSRSPHTSGGDAFDRAMASFAEAYADQNERDYGALQDAVASGRIATLTGV